MASPAFAAESNIGSGHWVNQKPQLFQYRSNYLTKSYRTAQYNKWKFGIKWKQSDVNKPEYNKHRYIYLPRYLVFGGDKTEGIGKVEVNLIVISNKKDEVKGGKVEEEKPVSPPHIVHLNDISFEKPDKHLKLSEKSNSVILIHGTRIIETRISPD